ncbi:MAG: hypothetical protein AB7L18_01545, partial [Hyphomicrobiaceae bacterium]
AAADDLADRLARGTNQVWLWDTALADSLASVVPDGSPAAEPGRKTEDSDADVDKPGAGRQARGPRGGAKPGARRPIDASTAPQDANAGAEPADSFDPFAFSAMVVLKREGRQALLKRLEGITDAAHLRRLAEAQHLGIDRHIEEPAELRQAIIAGAEQRIADRRAAAS